MPSLRTVNAILRVPLFVFAVIALGLTGRLRAHHYNTSRVNLGLAAAVIGLVFSVFVPIPMLFVNGLFNIPIMWILDFISFVLFLSAAASMTQQRHICHQRGNCGLYRAGIAFEYMCWIPLLFILAFEVYEFFAEEKGSGGGGGGGGAGWGGKLGYNSGSYRSAGRRRPAPGLDTTTPAQGTRVEDPVVEP